MDYTFMLSDSSPSTVSTVLMRFTPPIWYSQQVKTNTAKIRPGSGAGIKTICCPTWAPFFCLSVVHVHKTNRQNKKKKENEEKMEGNNLKGGGGVKVKTAPPSEKDNRTLRCCEVVLACFFEDKSTTSVTF